MSGYVIMVDFRLKPGTLKAFRALIDENAVMSCATEAGCRRFDVLEPKDGGDRVILYEIYDDRAAFEAHIKTAHFHTFNNASTTLVAEKVVSDYHLVCEGSAVTSGD
jgi:autoinducer 2-degrading protein